MSNHGITGDDWTFTLIFELVAELRNLLMFHPLDVDADSYGLFTKAFVDCKVKDVTEESDHAPTGYNVDEIFDMVTAAGGK